MLVRKFWVAALLFAIISVLSTAALCEPVSPPFKVLWSADKQYNGNSKLIIGNTVYLGDFNLTSAVSLSNGKQIWSKKYPRGWFGTDLATDGKTLYIAVGNGKLMACDPRTGKERWSIPINDYSGPMMIYKDFLLCELKSGTVSGVNIKTHKVVWSTKLVPGSKIKERDRGIDVSCKFVIHKGNLFVGTYPGDLYCLNPLTGKIIWHYVTDTPKEELAVKGIVGDDKRIYFTNENGDAIALDLSSGKRVWKFKTLDSIWSGPALSGGIVFVTSNDGRLYAVNAQTGAKLWDNRLATYIMPDLTTPIIDNGRVIVSTETLISAFDFSGKKLWEWRVDSMVGEGIVLLPDGILVCGDSFVRLVMGEPEKISTDTAERQKIAQKLAARFDSLSSQERKQLMVLGDEAFEAMLPVVKKKIQRWESLKADDKRSAKEYVSFEAAMEVFKASVSSKRTPEMLTLLNAAKTFEVKCYIYGWLYERGDKEQLVPMALDILSKLSSMPEREEMYNSNFALAILTETKDPRAVQFFLDNLKDPKAPYAFRRMAFLTLAGNGGEAGINAVLAAKDTDRTISSLEENLGLDKMPVTVKDVDEFDGPVPYNAYLEATKTDSSGTKWGLMTSRAVGSPNDAWTARLVNGKWADLVYTGANIDQVSKVDWITKYAKNSALSQDSDSDGWSDIIEKRLGTDPKNPDTDGDGLKDSQDRNPLAAPRQLTEDEEVLAAAFEANNIFTGMNDRVALVTFPKGIKPFELEGWSWIIIPALDAKKQPLAKFESKGIASISFRAPLADFNGAKQYETAKDQVILWNKDQTEAKVQIGTYFASLSATGCDIHLKKFGSRWVVVDARMVWVS